MPVAALSLIQTALENSHELFELGIVIALEFGYVSEMARGLPGECKMTSNQSIYQSMKFILHGQVYILG